MIAGIAMFETINGYLLRILLYILQEMRDGKSVRNINLAAGNAGKGMVYL